jgi:hypothetical protein
MTGIVVVFPFLRTCRLLLTPLLDLLLPLLGQDEDGSHARGK